MTELSDDELERRMRRKLFLDGKSNRGEQFTPEERAIADKIVGKHNVERLERRDRLPLRNAQNPRRFRPTPVFIHYEYWWVHGDERHFMTGWTMARIENGKRTDHHWTGTLEAEIRRLKAAGFTVKEIHIDGAPRLHEASATRHCDNGRRKSFAERFGKFDPEVD